MMASMCSYGRSNQRSLLQQFNSVYFKASGLAAKANNTTHLYGITMSHSWVYHLIDKLSEVSRLRMLEDICNHPFYASHDNLNLAFKVYDQRTNKQNHFDSGTAATVYILKTPSVEWPLRKNYQLQRAHQTQKSITAPKIMRLKRAAAPRICTQAIYRVIKFLIDTPDFDFDTYRYRSLADIFSPLPPVSQLPTGPEHATCQYMLDTIHIDLASQEGT